MSEMWSLPSYGITFNTNTPDDTGCRWFCTKDSGWRGGAAPRTNRDPKASGLGQFRRATKPGELVCSLDGEFYGSPTARSLAERKLARIGKDTPNLFEVRCTDAVGELFSMMELDGPTLAQPDNSDKDGVFSLQFASPDPRRYVVGQTIGGITGLASSSGGLDWSTGGGLNWPPGLNWGTVSSTGQLLFVNSGTTDTDPKFTISVPTGTLLNPTITFQTTGQVLRYNGTLAAGDTLVISTSEFNRSVVLNGGTDVRTKLNVAQWFEIPVGQSTVLFGADNVNAAAQLSGVAYIAYW